jgi:hypothetical protein
MSRSTSSTVHHTSVETTGSQSLVRTPYDGYYPVIVINLIILSELQLSTTEHTYSDSNIHDHADWLKRQSSLVF